MKPASVLYKHVGKEEREAAQGWARRGHHVFYSEADPSLPLGDMKPLPKSSETFLIPSRELVDAVFGLLYKDTPALSWAKELFGSDDIEWSFRRSISEGFLSLLPLLDSIDLAGLPEDGEVLLAPSVRLHPRFSWDPFIGVFTGLVVSGRLTEADVAEIPDRLRRVMARLRVESKGGAGHRFIERLFAPFFLFSRLRFFQGRRREFRLAIRAYSQDLGGGGRSGEPLLRDVDFLVDGEAFRPEDVVIWSERGMAPEREDVLRRRGYRVVPLSGLRLGPALFLRLIPALAATLAMSFRSMGSGPFEGLFCRRLFLAFVQTTMFVERFKPAVFLAFNDMVSASMARNLVLRSAGCRCVLYQHSSNNLTGRVDPGYSFIDYDVLVTWGPVMTRFFKAHPSRFKEVWEPGCLWSELVRRVKEDPGLRESSAAGIGADAGKPLSPGRRRIAVFDTTVNSLYFRREDCLAFLSDIAWLAGEFPEADWIYKPKYAPAEVVKVAGESYSTGLERLRDMPNARVLSKSFETAAVLGVADIAVSACFTSPTVEAAGGGVKALYHDPLDHCPPESWTGSFWHGIPGLVCRNREALRTRIRELLETPEEEYRLHLSRHWRDVEGHFDGRAIDRMRRRAAALAGPARWER